MGRVTLHLLVFMTSALVSTSAFAQAIGGSGTGGGGLRVTMKEAKAKKSKKVAKVSKRVGARNPGCEEGRRGIFMENDTHVFKTCHKGTYYDLSKYVYNPKAKGECKREGDRYIREMIKLEDWSKYYIVAYCRGGRLIDSDEVPYMGVRTNGD